MSTAVVRKGFWGKLETAKLKGVAVLLMFSTLISCGGGGGGNSSPQIREGSTNTGTGADRNQIPVAVAEFGAFGQGEVDQPDSAFIESLVILDGSASYDPENSQLTFLWTQVSGAGVILNDSTIANPEFHLSPFLEYNGEPLVFELVVHDGLDSSLPVTLTIHVIDDYPPETFIVNYPTADSYWPPQLWNNSWDGGFTSTGTTSYTTALFEFESDDSTAVFRASLDGGDDIEISSRWLLRDLADGVHTLEVAAVDPYGNADETPAIYSWTVDTGPLEAAFVFPTPVSSTEADQITVRGQTYETDNILSVLINGVEADTADNFSTWSKTIPLADGENNIDVQVLYEGGRTNTKPITAQVTRRGPLIVKPARIRMDTLRNRMLIFDQARLQIIAKQLDKNTTTLLVDREPIAGHFLTSVSDILVDNSEDRILILDAGNDAILSYDLVGESVGILVSPGVDPDLDLSYAVSMDLDVIGKRLFVSAQNPGRVLEIDLTTGTRRVVYKNPLLVFGDIGSVVYDNATTPSNPRLLVADASDIPGIYAMDIDSGTATLFSSATPVGSGPALQHPFDLAIDRADRYLVVSDVGNSSVFSVDLDTGNRTIAASFEVGNGYFRSLFEGIALNAETNVAYVNEDPDIYGPSGSNFFSVDLETLERSAFFNPHIGDGAFVYLPIALALDDTQLRTGLLIADFHQQNLLRLDIHTGRIDYVAPLGIVVGNGTDLSGPVDVVVDNLTDPSIPVAYVSDTILDEIFKVDLFSGERTTLSSSVIGSGINFANLRKITPDFLNRKLYAIDSELAAIISVNMDSGDREIVSDNTLISGFDFTHMYDVALDTTSSPNSQQILVIDNATDETFTDAVIGVNPGSGARSLLSSAPLTSGLNYFAVDNNIDIDKKNNVAIVMDGSSPNLTAVDLINGDRTLISGRTTPDGNLRGRGPEFYNPRSLAVDSEKSVAYIGDDLYPAIFAVDLVTGDRVIISNKN